jgi:hypothetical protein
VRPPRSFVDDEYHNSQRSVGKQIPAYRHHSDSYEQILMEAYPDEPKRVRLVDERSIDTGRRSRFVVKRVDEDTGWDEQKPGKAY